MTVYVKTRPVRGRTHSDSGDMPRPLHVTKRSALAGSNRIARNTRGCSPASDQSDATIDSPPEPPGSNRPLTLPKKRGGREGWAVYHHPVGCRGDRDRDARDADEREGSPLAGLAAPQPLRSASCAGSYQLSSRLPHRHSPPDRSDAPPWQLQDGSPNHECTNGGTSPALSAPPEDLRREDSPLRDAEGLFHLPPSYYSDSGARTLHFSALTDRGTPPAPPSLTLPEHWVLAPRIVVTPEFRTVDEGAATVWAAVELSTELCRVGSQGGHHDPVTYDELSPDVLRYGFLYDVSVEIVPTSKSTVVEVLDEKACTRILHPGARLLFVAHVRLEPAARRQPHSHVRQNSDDLIEDLELQLGGTMTEYVQVRLTYRHSAFPQRNGQTPGTADTTAPDGLASLQTVLQTTAVATIKRRNSASPWSPPPSIQRPNPLFHAIASHWGTENAHAVMQRVIRSRSVPRKTDPALPSPLSRPPVPDFRSFLAVSEQVRYSDTAREPEHIHHKLQPTAQEDHTPKTPRPPTRPAPPIPRRQASLRFASTSTSTSASSQNHSEPHDPTPPGTAVRRKGHRRIRRAASLFQASSSLSGPPPALQDSTNNSGADVEGSTSLPAARAESETERQRALRGKWTEAAPAALTPVVVDVKIDGDGQVKGLDAGVDGGSGNGSVKARKGKGKERGWWIGWWQ